MKELIFRFMHRRENLFYAAIVLCLHQNAALIAQDVSALSMNEAIGLALTNNSEVAIASYQVKGSEYFVKEAKGGHLPKLMLNGTYTRNVESQVMFLPEGVGPGGATKVGSDNNFISYLDFSLPVFVKNNMANREYAYGNYDFQKEVQRGTGVQVTANVKKSYVTHLLAVEIVEVRKKGLENAYLNISNIEEKLNEGVATEFDRITARVRVASAKTNLVEAESQLTPSADKLKLVIGLPLDTKVNLTDSLFITTDELAKTEVNIDLLHNSELKQKELQKDIARLQTSLAKAAYFPMLNIIGSYQLQSQDNTFEFQQYDWVRTSFVGLRLQLPIFNGMVTRYKVHQAVQAEKIAQLQKEYTLQKNSVQFRELKSKLIHAKRRIELQDENIALARVALELAKERYHYGKATFLEVNNAETEYIGSRITYLEAIVDYKLAYYDLELLIGEEN
jgi:outer membrane protein